MANPEIKEGENSKEKKENTKEMLNRRFNGIFEKIGDENNPTEFINSKGEKILMYKVKINDYSDGNPHTTNLRKIYICKAFDPNKPMSINPIKNIKSREGLLSFADGSYDSSNFIYKESGEIDSGRTSEQFLPIFPDNHHLTNEQIEKNLTVFENMYEDYKKGKNNVKLQAYNTDKENDEKEADQMLHNLESGNLIG